MKRMNLALILSMGVALAGCGSKTNPNVCCTDSANCAAEGLPDDAQCTGGLICRGNQCVAETCSTAANCEAGAPFCTGTGLCAMTCDSDAECPGFGGDGKHVFCMSGACVQCRSDDDCSGDAPLCNTTTGTCHGCTVDADCPSGACGTTGACVAEADLIYVDGTAGSDVGQCTKTSPCKTLQFGIGTAVLARSNIVLTALMYTENITINNTTTSASTITIHGHGATLRSLNGNDGPTITPTNVGVTIVDTNFVGNGTAGGPIQTYIAPVEMRHVKIMNDGPIGVGSNLTLSDVEIADAFSDGIQVDGSSHLLADRLYIHGGYHGLRSPGPGAPTLAISNMLVTGTSGAAVDITQAIGAITNSTIADAAGPGVIGCSSTMKFQADIIWNPRGAPIDAGCNVLGTIAGPSGNVGMQTDPQFVDETHRDYHLKATSPAIDIVDSGPGSDLDGVARPQGARFDLGAFEYKP